MCPYLSANYVSDCPPNMAQVSVWPDNLQQIYETVWGKEYFCDEGNVTAHIGHIRKKIELDPRNPVFIQTVRGIGYKFAKK